MGNDKKQFNINHLDIHKIILIMMTGFINDFMVDFTKQQVMCYAGND